VTQLSETLRPGRAGWRRRGAAMALLLSPLLAWSVLLPGTARAELLNLNISGVQAVTSSTAALAPGQSSWVSVAWTSRATVTDWSTTVTAPAGVTVTYPTTRGGSDTSLYGSATLAGGTQDFTAFKLSVPYTQRTSFRVTITSTYMGCTGLLTCLDVLLAGDRSTWAASGIRQSTLQTTVTVPVVAATGVPFTQDTTQVAVAAGSDGFSSISFTGGQTDLAGFTVRAGALPAGLQVGYPGDRSASTLNSGSTLVGRSTDHVGIRFITTGLAPGTYVVPLTISYTAAAPVTAVGAVTLVVS